MLTIKDTEWTKLKTSFDWDERGELIAEFDSYILSCRILQGDPSLPEQYKQHKYFNTWKRPEK
jgi:hypothetical protein